MIQNKTNKLLAISLLSSISVGAYADYQIQSEYKATLQNADNHLYFGRLTNGTYSLISEREDGAREANETFVLQNLGGNKVAFIGSQGNYLRDHSGGGYIQEFSTSGTALTPSTVFTLVKGEDGHDYIKSSKGLFLKVGESDRNLFFSNSGTPFNISNIGNVVRYPIEYQGNTTKADKHRAVAIENLPAGVSIEGLAKAPATSSAGTPDDLSDDFYYQIVSFDALVNGDLKLVVANGYVGDINLKVVEYFGDVIYTSDGSTELAATQFNELNSHVLDHISKTINLTANTSFAAMTGSLQFDIDSVLSKEIDITLKTKDGYYVRAKSGGGDDVNAKSKLRFSNDILTMIDRGNDKFSFRTKNGRFIDSCGKKDGDSNLNAYGRSLSSDCTKFEMYIDEDRLVSFLAEDKKHFWKAINGGNDTIKVNASELVDNTKFKLKEFNAPNRSTLAVPLYFAINPNVINDRIILQDVPTDATITYGDNATEVNYDETLNGYEVTGLTGILINIDSIDASFDIQAIMSADNAPTLTETLHISDLAFQKTSNDEVYALIPGHRNQYSISRAANAWVITEIATGDVVRLDMTTTPYLMFDNAIGSGDITFDFKNSVVSASDFSHEVDISTIDTSSIADHQLMIISNLPDNAIVNNSIALGNGAFGLFGNRLPEDNKVYIETSTVYADEEINVSIGFTAEAVTEEEYNFLNGQGTVSGYASASVHEEIGANANIEVGEDGLAMEARAYYEFTAVATAGGSFRVDGVATAEASATASYTVSAEISAEVVVNDENIVIGAEAGYEETASVEVVVVVDSEAVPGTRAEASGAAGVTSYAYVGVNGGLYYNDGTYGSEGEFGAEYGTMATADGYASGSLCGVGTSAGAGVSAGSGVGIAGGYTGMYEKGEITVGVSGDVALLLGIEADIEVSLDINEVADTAKLIESGVLTAADAVAAGLITATDAIENYGLDVTDAVAYGFITTQEAIDDFGAKASELSKKGYKKVRKGINSAYKEVKSWF